MSDCYPQRMSAAMQGDFVVLLIGMRINKPWKIHVWWPVFRAMLKMLRELRQHPEAGLMHYTMGPRVIVQYWRSFEHLEAYASNHGMQHYREWQKFNRMIQKHAGDVGIWHETYPVRAGEFEAIYHGMPRFGLAMAGELIPATGRYKTAGSRLHANRQQQKASQSPPGNTG